MMGRRFTILIFTLLIVLAIIHKARADNATGRQQGRELATQQRATISGMFDEMPDNATVPGYVGTTLPEGGYDSDTLGAADNMTLNERAAQAKETVFSQPRWDIEDGQLDGALAVQANPGEFHGLGDFLSGEYEACDPTITMSGEPATEHFCDRWRPTEDSECTSTVGVTYGRDITYQCQRDTPDTYKKCDEFYEPVCEMSTDSYELLGGNGIIGRSGSLYPRPYTSEFKTDDSGRVSLHMGRPSGHPAIHYGNKRQRKYFNLIALLYITTEEKLNNITSFALTRTRWDDGIEIKINGNSVYRAGKAWRNSDQGRARDGYPNRELKEHLRVGVNKIELIGLVIGAGQFWAVFDTAGCAEITGEWREVCEE